MRAWPLLLLVALLFLPTALAEDPFEGGIHRRVGATGPVAFCVTVSVPDEGTPTAYVDLERVCGEPPTQGT